MKVQVKVKEQEGAGRFTFESHAVSLGVLCYIDLKGLRLISDQWEQCKVLNATTAASTTTLYMIIPHFITRRHSDTV